MKQLLSGFTLFIALFLLHSMQAQTTDTTVYTVLEEMPRFPACEQLDTTIDVKNECAQRSLLAFVNRTVVYPMEARQNGNEGTVVVTFIVEPDGSLTSPNIVKDIGGGCGLAVLDVVQLMNQQQIRWVPGKKGGAPVRARYSLPVKFKITEAPPYAIVGTDTVYTTFDKNLEYNGGNEALQTHLLQQLKYPEEGNDSCSIGQIDVQIMVRPDGYVKVLDVTDYSDLGGEFLFQAIYTAVSTMYKWEPAVYKEKAVPASIDLNFRFTPQSASCKTVVSNYEKANQLAEEGMALYNDGKQDEGIAKLTEAVDMFPGNANFRYLRGNAFLNANRLTEACSDLTFVRSTIYVDWFDNILPLICRGQ